ncbi:MAG TPA: ATP-binding cassette domain-containing protein, partial [Puia sp.]
MNTRPIIEIKNLTKRFKRSTEDAVKDISFTVNRNEIFGLLGPNGAGKTTTLSILCGLFPPTRGTVVIDGKNIRQ